MGKQDTWTSYLTGLNQDQGGGLGWCTEYILGEHVHLCVTLLELTRSYVSEKPELCCKENSTHGLACFSSKDSNLQGCLDPVPILTSLEESRCSYDGDCLGKHSCLRLDGGRKLLRLMVHRPSDGVSEVVLWSGPLKEVWEEGERAPCHTVWPSRMFKHFQYASEPCFQGSAFCQCGYLVKLICSGSE